MRFEFIRCGEGQALGAGALPHAARVAQRLLRVAQSRASQRALEDARLGTLVVALIARAVARTAARACIATLRDAGKRDEPEASRAADARSGPRRRDEEAVATSIRRAERLPPAPNVARPRLQRRRRRIGSGPPTSPTCERWEGWLYLAVVIDLFSRRVVGWSMQSAHATRDLVLVALTMAVGQRLPGPGLLHHSDRGSSVHERRLPARAARPRHRVQHEPQGQLLGQRRRRELLRHARSSELHSPPALADPQRGRRRHPRVHRGLLQPSSSPLDPRQPRPPPNTKLFTNDRLTQAA